MKNKGIFKIKGVMKTDCTQMDIKMLNLKGKGKTKQERWSSKELEIEQDGERTRTLLKLSVRIPIKSDTVCVMSMSFVKGNVLKKRSQIFFFHL